MLKTYTKVRGKLKSDLAVRNAKPEEKPYKRMVGDGLYLLVNPNGSKLWRLKYHFGDKEKLLALGSYSKKNGFKVAKELAADARKKIEKGIDPSVAKQTEKSVNLDKYLTNFEAVASEWMQHKARDWTDSYAEKIRGTFQSNVFPRIGMMPISDIEVIHIAEALAPIEARGAGEQARRTLRFIKGVFKRAVVKGFIKSSPIVSYEPKDLFSKRTKRNNPHLKQTELGDFLRALEEYRGLPQTRIAVKLLMLTIVRTAELRGAKWAEFDLPNASWNIPAGRMKMRKAHTLPLPRQAIALLKELHKLTGYSEYLFPNHGKHPYMSENTINKAIALLGYKGRIVGHGFRHTASTILNESTLFRAEVIEAQLAHKDSNEIRAIYNKATYLPERKTMMQWYADLLDREQRGSDIVNIKCA
jgi:integrase